jgi:hypothetical protein
MQTVKSAPFLGGKTKGAAPKCSCLHKGFATRLSLKAGSNPSECECLTSPKIAAGIMLFGGRALIRTQSKPDPRSRVAANLVKVLPKWHHNIFELL